MAKLKAYTLGINGFSRPWMNEALSAPGHVRQVDTTIVARTKAEAANLADAVGFHRPSLSDPEFRMISGPTEHPTTVALLECADGVPTVFVSEFNAGDGAPILGLDADGNRRIVGHLRRLSADTFMQTFVPTEES